MGGKKILLLKPQTFMNLSGEAVREAASFYKIPPERIIVLFDDTTLDIGRVRIRKKGSDGGHNGIKSIILCLSSADFPRVKIGIGQKPSPEFDLADWVLSHFTKEEGEELEKAVDHALRAVELMISGETEKAMNLYNQK